MMIINANLCNIVSTVPAGMSVAKNDIAIKRRCYVFSMLSITVGVYTRIPPILSEWDLLESTCERSSFDQMITHLVVGLAWARRACWWSMVMMVMMVVIVVVVVMMKSILLRSSHPTTPTPRPTAALWNQNDYQGPRFPDSCIYLLLNYICREFAIFSGSWIIQ